MAIYEHDSDFVRWGLRLLNIDDDPVLNYGYYGGDDIYHRQSYGVHYDIESNNVENDEIIAHTLQEEFSRLDVAESSGYLRGGGGDQLQESAIVNAWQSPPRNYSSGCDFAHEKGAVPSSSCSSPGDQDEYLHSLELSDEYAQDDEVCWKFDQMAPSPHIPRINGEIPSIDEATSDHQRLLNRLESFGFIEHKVQGDGNCQFRALSDQLYDTPDNHKNVRCQIVNQLKSHPEIYEGYVPMAYDDYLEKMSNKPVAANGAIMSHYRQLLMWYKNLSLMKLLYDVKIIVMTSFKDTYCIEILPKFQKPKRVICLSFWAEVHYNSIYPQAQGDAPSGQCRKKRKWWMFGNKH